MANNQDSHTLEAFKILNGNDKAEQLYLRGYQIQSKPFQPQRGNIPSTMKHLALQKTG